MLPPNTHALTNTHSVLLTQPWIAELMTLNLNTGQREEASTSVWEAATEACDLTDTQVALYGECLAGGAAAACSNVQSSRGCIH